MKSKTAEMAVGCFVLLAEGKEWKIMGMNDRSLSVANCAERAEETYCHLFIMISMTRKNMS